MGNQKQQHGDVHYPERIAKQAEAPEPGKATLVPAQPGVLQTGAYQTGHDYADSGTKCERPAGASACFLPHLTRARIIGMYQARVTAAQAQYIGALTQLRAEELMKKDPDKSQWLFELFLDVIGMVTVKTAGSVLGLLRGGNTATVADVVGDARALVSAVQSTSQQEIQTVVGAAIGGGRRMLPQQADKDPDDGKKAANIAYLDLLTNESAAIYERLREGAIAQADDSTLMVLFDSFAAHSLGHTLQGYKDAITGKLERFKKSEIPRMGITDRPGAWSGMGLEETKAFWIKTPIGRRLALYRRRHEHIGRSVAQTRGWRDRTDDEMKAAEEADLAARPFVFMHYVSDEMTSIAVAMHTSKWGAPPEEHAAGQHEIMQMGSNR